MNPVHAERNEIIQLLQKLRLSSAWQQDAPGFACEWQRMFCLVSLSVCQPGSLQAEGTQEEKTFPSAGSGRTLIEADQLPAASPCSLKWFILCETLSALLRLEPVRFQVVCSDLTPMVAWMVFGVFRRTCHSLNVISQLMSSFTVGKHWNGDFQQTYQWLFPSWGNPLADVLSLYFNPFRIICFLSADALFIVNPRLSSCLHLIKLKDGGFLNLTKLFLTTDVDNQLRQSVKQRKKLPKPRGTLMAKTYFI